jgi:hypothetical protein
VVLDALDVFEALEVFDAIEVLDTLAVLDGLDVSETLDVALDVLDVLNELEELDGLEVLDELEPGFDMLAALDVPAVSDASALLFEALVPLEPADSAGGGPPTSSKTLATRAAPANTASVFLSGDQIEDMDSPSTNRPLLLVEWPVWIHPGERLVPVAIGRWS